MIIPLLRHFSEQIGILDQLLLELNHVVSFFGQFLLFHLCRIFNLIHVCPTRVELLCFLLNLSHQIILHLCNHCLLVVNLLRETNHPICVEVGRYRSSHFHVSLSFWSLWVVKLGDVCWGKLVLRVRIVQALALRWHNLFSSEDIIGRCAISLTVKILGFDHWHKALIARHQRGISSSSWVSLNGLHLLSWLESCESNHSVFGPGSVFVDPALFLGREPQVSGNESCESNSWVFGPYHRLVVWRRRILVFCAVNKSWLVHFPNMVRFRIFFWGFRLSRRLSKVFSCQHFEVLRDWILSIKVNAVINFYGLFRFRCLWFWLL